MATDRRVHWPAMRLFALLGVGGAFLSAPPIVEGQSVLVAVPKLGATPGVIWRLDDLNNDGDADDPGETNVFRDKAGVGILTDDFTDVAWSRSGVVYAVESKGNRVLRLQDLNLDGDAQDAGEATVFRDGTSEGMRLKMPFSVALTQNFDVNANELRDVVYVYDPDLQATARLEDLDGDGDAQGSTEICLFHQSIQSKPLTAPRMATDDAGRLLAADPNRRAVIRTIDHNGDCNASVNPREQPCPPQFVFNEYHVVKNDSGVDPDLFRPTSIAIRSEEEAIFVGEAGRAQTEGQGRLFQLRDLNIDDDAQDAGEVTVFSNGICSGIRYVNPTALGVDKAGRLYVADFSLPAVLRLQDLNSDQDALDVGECAVFASRVGQPVGLAIQPPAFPPLEIRPGTGIVDLGKKTDIFLPDAAPQNFKVEVVDRDTGLGVPNMKVACDVIAGCLLCTPKNGRTDASGVMGFQVSRLGMPQGDEGLIVSTLGNTLDINVTPVIPFECPFAALLEGDPGARAKSAPLYALRDKVLASSPDGQRYIRLFKRHALEVTTILLADRALRQQAQELFGRLLPVLRTRLAKAAPATGTARVEGAGIPALARADVVDVESVMKTLAAKGSPELQRTLSQLRRELRAGRITGVMGIPVKPAGAQGRPEAERPR